MKYPSKARSHYERVQLASVFRLMRLKSHANL